MTDWQPSATHDALVLRSALLMHARHFFVDHGLIEVDTPIVVNAPVTDVHIHSARVLFEDESHSHSNTGPAGPAGSARPYFLHTSPEYAMKRLLASGSGDIFQICHVIRGLERGKQHNAEFTLIEWYRLGYTLDKLMEEVELLVRHLLGEVAFNLVNERITYQQAFRSTLGIDPLTASTRELMAVAQEKAGFRTDRLPQRDELLELLMGTVIGPRLGQNSLTFVYNYPSTQAALARLNPHDPRTALRFELYCQGMELANGFHELASAAEQRARFERDNNERRRLGMPVYEVDERLLAALEIGLPDCAGVALGFDRTLMLAAEATHIDQVLPFPTERA
jgi:elongation factor P--(R)-beta-lysine ligase